MTHLTQVLDCARAVATSNDLRAVLRLRAALKRLDDERADILDMATFTLHGAAGVKHLPRQQCLVLQRLLVTPGQIVPHDALLDALYADREDGGPDEAQNLLKVLVTRIRKAARDVEAPVQVMTAWGVGYRVEIGW